MLGNCSEAARKLPGSCSGAARKLLGSRSGTARKLLGVYRKLPGVQKSCGSMRLCVLPRATAWLALI
eukprot:3455741-Alexandrium_andersonii.AAC.1